MSELSLEMLMKLRDEASEKIDALQGKMRETGETGKTAGEGVGGIGTAAMALGGAAIIGAVVGFGAAVMGLVNIAAEEERGIALLGQAVRNTGADWDTASVAIEDYLTAELARTALDDGDGRAAIQKLTEATGSYETALDLMTLTQDLAAAKGIDLATAADIVGKVHEGNTGSLSRYGIVLEEGASATDALAAMTERFGGAAETAGGTYQASSARVGIAMGNIKETIGGALLTAVQPITDAFADMAQRALPLVEGAIDALKPAFNWLTTDGKPILIALGVIVGVVLVAAFVAMGAAAWAAAAPIIAAVGAVLVPLLPFIAIIVGIGALIVLIRTAWENNWGGMQEKVAAVLAWFTTAFTVTLPGLFNSVIGAISTPFAQAWALLGAAWAVVETWFTTAFTVTLPGVFNTIIDAIITPFETAWGLLSAAWQVVEGWFTTAFTVTLPGVFNTILNAIKSPFQEAWDWLTGLWGGITDWLHNLFSGIHIPMPHFSVNWTEVLGIRIPSGISVDWYGSGANFVTGGPLLMGVGERGPERVIIQPLAGGGGAGAGATY